MQTEKFEESERARKGERDASEEQQQVFFSLGPHPLVRLASHSSSAVILLRRRLPGVVNVRWCVKRVRSEICELGRCSLQDRPGNMLAAGDVERRRKGEGSEEVRERGLCSAVCPWETSRAGNRWLSSEVAVAKQEKGETTMFARTSPPCKI